MIAIGPQPHDQPVPFLPESEEMAFVHEGEQSREIIGGTGIEIHAGGEIGGRMAHPAARESGLAQAARSIAAGNHMQAAIAYHQRLFRCRIANADPFIG